MPVHHNISRQGHRKKPPVRGAGVEHPPLVSQLNHEEEHEPKKSETHVDQLPVEDHTGVVNLDSDDDSGTDPEEFGENNECPACRMHCASRRSMRDDTCFDTLISTLYADVEKYEDEEMILHEQERAFNEQIQEAITQISRRQSEALAKVPKASKETDSLPRLGVPRNSQNAYSRRKNNKISGFEASDEIDGDNGAEGNISSPIEERQSEVMKRRRGRPRRASERATGPAMEDIRDSPSSSIPQTLNWGPGGARSRTRHGLANGRKAARRISRLADYLDISGKNEEHPMITALTHDVQMIWKKDGCAQNLNPSSSMDVPEVPPPPKVANWASNKSVLQILEGREIP